MGSYTERHKRYHATHKGSPEYLARRAAAQRAYQQRRRAKKQEREEAAAASPPHQITVSHGGVQVVLEMREVSEASESDTPEVPPHLRADAQLCPFKAGFA
jgi:hypothetical protein